MKLGPSVRRMFGPFERHVSDAYRSIYIDLDAFIELTLRWKPSADNILEVGCGEGAVTRRLTAAFPAANITAIDITPNVGRLFGHPADRVNFKQCTVQDVAAANAGPYDLVVLSDVLHHVPLPLRQGLLIAIRTVLASKGTPIFKDWARNLTPIHWLCHASDRWLTGDRISYLTREEMRHLLAMSFGESALLAEAMVRPWRNNLAILVQP